MCVCVCVLARVLLRLALASQLVRLCAWQLTRPLCPLPSNRGNGNPPQAELRCSGVLASIQIQDVIDVGRPGPAFGSGSGLAAGGSSKALLLPGSGRTKSGREPGRAVFRGLWRGQAVAVKTRLDTLSGGRCGARV